jgi:hypothetical protein
MKSLRVLLVAISVVPAGMGGAAALVAGCGSSGGGGEPVDSGGGSDSTMDTGMPPPDTGSMQDTFTADVADSGPPVDSGEAGPIDASDIFLFPQRVTEAYCTALQTCCANAAGFNMNFCITSTLAQGGFNGDGLGNYSGRIPNNGGAITFNATSAQTCLTEIAALPCGMVTSQQLVQIRNDCYGALVGTIPVGGTGCTTSLDCAPQGWCSIVGDAGTCTALAGDGGACGVGLAPSIPSNDQCSYRGTGQPALYCDNQVPDGGGTHTCLAQPGPGGTCGTTFYYGQECTTEICTGTCGMTTPFSDPGVPGGLCASLAPQDAGGGG